VILFHEFHQQVWTICMLAVCALAFWRGGWPERTAAIGMLVDSLSSGLLQNTHDWGQTQWADLAIDVAYLALLLWLALRSHRFWPLFAAAFQLLSVVIYVARMADYSVGARATYNAVVILGYLILLAIVYGIVGRWRRSIGPRAGPP
jgi:hypothetical protein